MLVKLLKCRKQKLMLKTTPTLKILLLGFLSILEFYNSQVLHKLVTHKLLSLYYILKR